MNPAPCSCALFYQTTLNLEGAERQYMEYVKSAYRESDLKTVRVIRLLLAEGTCQKARAGKMSCQRFLGL